MFLFSFYASLSCFLSLPLALPLSLSLSQSFLSFTHLSPCLSLYLYLSLSPFPTLPFSFSSNYLPFLSPSHLLPIFTSSPSPEQPQYNAHQFASSSFSLLASPKDVHRPRSMGSTSQSLTGWLPRLRRVNGPRYVQGCSNPSEIQGLYAYAMPVPADHGPPPAAWLALAHFSHLIPSRCTRPRAHWVSGPTSGD